MKHKKDKRDNFPIPVQCTSLTGMTRTKHVLCSASTNPLGVVNRYHIVTTGPCEIDSRSSPAANNKCKTYLHFKQFSSIVPETIQTRIQRKFNMENVLQVNENSRKLRSYLL